MDALLKDRKFQTMRTKHCQEILDYLMRKKINFSILCNLKCVKFDPLLPESISNSFSDLTVFILAGYTFESLELSMGNLYFEAGFGEDNTGSFVTVPLECIVQILLPNTDHLVEKLSSDFVLYVNLLAMFAHNQEILPKATKKEKDGINNSLRALLSNPKNKRFKK